MKKHYFLQNLTTSTIYHLDLSTFYKYVDYQSVLAQAFRITELDLLCHISKDRISPQLLAYNILVYSFASLSGFNQRSSEFKCTKAILVENLPNISIVHNAIKNFKPFYKLFKSENFYGLLSFKNSTDHNGGN